MDKIKPRLTPEEKEGRATPCNRDDLEQVLNAISRKMFRISSRKAERIVDRIKKIHDLLLLLERMKSLSPTDSALNDYGQMIWDMIRETNRKATESEGDFENDSEAMELLRISRVWLRMATIYFTRNMGVEDEDNTIVDPVKYEE